MIEKEPPSTTGQFEPRELGTALSLGEKEWLAEILTAIRTIQYGSVLVTLHDGQVVEIQKTERIRRGTKR